MKKILLAYSAGSLGAIANFTFGIVLSASGIMALLGVEMPPPPMPAALYQRLVWGGIWGVAVFFPFWRGNVIVKGFLLGVLPSLVAGLVVFPSRGAGNFGINFGMVFPILIFLFNWVWGVVTLSVYRVTAS